MIAMGVKPAVEQETDVTPGNVSTYLLGILCKKELSVCSFINIENKDTYGINVSLNASLYFLFHVLFSFVIIIVGTGKIAGSIFLYYPFSFFNLLPVVR